MPQIDSNPADNFPAGDNQWHLLYTTAGFERTGTFKSIDEPMNDQDADHPGERNNIYRDPINKIVLLNPPVTCVNGGPPQTNACTFATGSARQNDDHSISYSVRNWGGRCVLSIRVMVYAPISEPHWTDTHPWSEGSPFIVIVPEEATSATVFGKIRGENIYFTPSEDLSPHDRERFEYVDKKVVPGLGTIFRFKSGHF